MPNPSTPPIGTRPASVADRVAGELLSMIGHGTILPGERLPGERQLAERMGVSRVSVRAALQRLKTQGLVESVQGGGTRVVSSAAELDGPLSELVRADIENLLDLAEIRVILEGWAARRAAVHATDADLAEISRILTGMAKPGRDTAEDDIAFHMAIGRAAHSPVYSHILSVIRDTLTDMLNFHRHRLFGAGFDEPLLIQHRAIHDAIMDHDADAAAAAMTHHLNWVLMHYRKIGNSSS